MRICIVIPSEQQEAQAGVRIRYRRIESFLGQRGHKIELTPIQNLANGTDFVHDIYVISKCYDARALVLARHLNKLGKPVGVDLFDDYFSQYHDSRFVRLRYWLRSLAPCCSFILCSTPRMREVAQGYAPGVPAHVMNDPVAAISMNEIAEAARAKLEMARSSSTINVAWFGMGDNPSFPVGLADLVAFGSEVDRLRGHGYDVRLEVLTNRRAMTPDNLAGLKRLATPYTIDEWDETRERELLARSLVAFLPVNAQNFSRVKSMNRALTALTAGCQVLSAGFPLYEPLAPFVYRDSRRLLSDLRNGELLLRESTVATFQSYLSTLADPDREAGALADFLQKFCNGVSMRDKKNGMSAVIHGKETLGDIHKFAQRVGALSVASPFCRSALNYDVRIDFGAGSKGFDVYISSKKISLVAAAIRPQLVSHGTILSTEYKKLRTEAVFPELQIPGSALVDSRTLSGDTAAYPLVMVAVCDVMGRLFSGVTCIHAEHCKLLPWDTLAANAGANPGYFQ